ncbi:MAG: TonB-dependent receptor [Bacteroidota bacterium]
MRLQLAYLLGVLLCLPSLTLAQYSLTGQVLDASEQSVLPGANVLLTPATQQLSSGTFAGLNGQFAFTDVPAGLYVLSTSMVGYTAGQDTIAVPGPAVTVALQPEEIQLGFVVAEAVRPMSAASSRAVRAFDLYTRPLQTPRDLLNLTPGLVTAQHAGGGKADQLFLRGFDADHGTDVALSVDGMPVNMVSHGHGQGYADLHFVIPETIARVEVQRGPYDAAYGNLATAGAISYETRDHIDENLIRAEGGAFDTRALTALYQVPLAGEHQGAYIAGQYRESDGPVESPQGFQRFALFGKIHAHVTPASRLAISAGGFSSAWDASGQIPLRAVESGLISRFGAINDLEGGATSRYNLAVSYEVEAPGRSLDVRAYGSSYAFRLYSDFTFFLDDPVRGDMIEQVDQRALYGLQATYHQATSSVLGAGNLQLGAGFRADDALVQLWKSPMRIRDLARVDADVSERNVFLWGEHTLVPASWLTVQVGLRGDYFTFDVLDRLEGTPSDLPHASGVAQASRLSPKANLVFGLSPTLDLYANAGIGFHSNDARSVVLADRAETVRRSLRQQGASASETAEALASMNLDPELRNTPLPKAFGTELGARFRPTPGVQVAGALWLLDLDREFVYVGDGGFTELSGATRRVGIDLEMRWAMARWLSADADVNLSRGVFRDAPADERDIALAPRVTAVGGLTFGYVDAVNGSLRLRHIGDRPANEAGTVTAEGYTVVDLFVRRPFGPIALELIVENLLDVDWNEAQFDTESRLSFEPAPVSELHFTPGTPRAIRLAVSTTF